MSTKLQQALVGAGVSQLVISTGNEKKGNMVTLKLNVTDVPDASHMLLYRYGRRKLNDVVNSAWGRNLRLKAEGKSFEAITEQEFRQKEVEAFEKAMLSGDWTKPRSALTYEVRAERYELGAWLLQDGMSEKEHKKVANNNEALWQIVTRRRWLKLATNSGMSADDLKAVDLIAKVDENLEACKADFADAIEARAAVLKAADEDTGQAVAPTSGMKL